MLSRKVRSEVEGEIFVRRGIVYKVRPARSSMEGMVASRPERPVETTKSEVWVCEAKVRRKAA